MQGYCRTREDWRLFKLSRMARVNMEKEHFTLREPPAEIELPQVNPPPAQVLRFAPASSYRIYDEFDPQHIERCADGSFLVRVCFPEDEWFYSYLLSFGTVLEVLSPPHVRAELLRRLHTMTARYET